MALIFCGYTILDLSGKPRTSLRGPHALLACPATRGQVFFSRSLHFLQASDERGEVNATGARMCVVVDQMLSARTHMLMHSCA